MHHYFNHNATCRSCGTPLDDFNRTCAECQRRSVPVAHHASVIAATRWGMPDWAGDVEGELWVGLKLGRFRGAITDDVLRRSDYFRAAWWTARDFFKSARGPWGKVALRSGPISGPTGEPLHEPKAPDAAIEQRELEEWAQDKLSELPEHERQVIELRLGIGGGPELSLGEIAKLLDIPRERVRQIERRAMRRLCPVTPPKED